MANLRLLALTHLLAAGAVPSDISEVVFCNLPCDCTKHRAKLRKIRFSMNPMEKVILNKSFNVQSLKARSIQSGFDLMFARQRSTCHRCVGYMLGCVVGHAHLGHGAAIREAVRSADGQRTTAAIRTDSPGNHCATSIHRL